MKCFSTTRRWLFIRKEEIIMGCTIAPDFALLRYCKQGCRSVKEKH